MTSLAKFLLLLTLLLMGAYVNHNASNRMEQQRRRQQRLARLKASATAEDYAFVKRVLNADAAFMEAASTSSTSLVAKDGVVIGEGHDRSEQLNDPSAHAEMEAVKAACKYVGAATLEGSVLYTSSKPCPMCLALLYKVEVERIVYYMPADTTPTANASNRRIFEALKQDPAYRPIPELVLQPSDLEKLAGGDGRRTR